MHQHIGRDRRDDALDRVLANESEMWTSIAIATVLRDFKVPWVGYAEEWQEPVRAEAGAPREPGAWGALAMRLIRWGYFEHTGVHDMSRRPTNNACDAKQMRRTQK